MDAFLHKSLDEGVTLLCASQRLAHRLRLDYAKYAQGQGRTAWLTPRILTFNAYLSEVFARQRQHHAGSLRLLDELQTRTIWETIVASSNHGLLSTAQTARAALRSWQLLQQHQIPLQKLADSSSEETRVFYQWAQQFVRHTDEYSQLDHAQLPAWIMHSTYVPETAVHVIGFDNLPPSFTALLDHWRDLGCEIRVHDNPNLNATTRVVAVNNADEELESAARWARHQMELGKQRIGVVVPELNVIAARVKRVFSAVLAPSSSSNQHENVSPFSVAASTDVASYPLVNHALLCLRLLQDNVEFECWEKLLRSPFIAGHETEANDRAALDMVLRQSHQERWTVQEVSRRASQSCPLLSQLLHAVAELAGTIRDKCLPSQWTTHFNRLLTAIGWSTGRTLSSPEQQLRNKFHEVMAQLSVLDEVAKRVDWRQALQLLRGACQQIRFAPETLDEAITVIDADTAAGMHFDALWIMGVHADAWPAVTDPDPFIPLQLQRQHGIAAAQAETLLQTTRKKLLRMVNSAKDTVLSWPQHDGDVELRASTLLQWPVISLQDLPHSDVTTMAQGLLDAKPKLESFVDVSMPAHPGGTIRHGARAFELQSRCAFRAQAELRLHAAAPESLPPGISPLDHGKLVHAVLQEVWNTLRDSQGLHDALQSASALRSQLEQITSRKAQHLLPATTLHQQRMVNVESRVVVNLIMQMLHHESGRGHFAVQSSEQREPFSLQGLNFHIQPDRIDQLDDGSMLLIDYKTGEANRPQDWLDNKQPGRPRSPQLPLYALAHPRQLSGIAYAILAPGVTELRGLADRDGIAGNIRDYATRNANSRVDGIDTWPQLMQHWHQVLTNLAVQFRQGVAGVNPLPNECQYCPLTVLCRIKEQSKVSDSLEGDSDE